MKKRDIYGFKIIDEEGIGFYRWFNGNPVKITDNPEGNLPLLINHIYIAQYYLDFHSAYKYCKDATQRYKLRFITLTEENWDAVEHPVKRFFKQLLKKINSWQH
jgi:hypothetical protein